jgi:energy-coupling factor transport system ATP-binding protein
MEEAARADRVVVINDGKLAMDSTAKEVFSRVDELHSMGLESPQGRELIHLLNSLGCNLETDALSDNECAEALINFLRK